MTSGFPDAILCICMGSIQNKRASGRGAPPQVYSAFFSPGDDDEDILAGAKLLGWAVVIGLIIGFILMFLSAGGMNPFDYIVDND